MVNDCTNHQCDRKLNNDSYSFENPFLCINHHLEYYKNPDSLSLRSFQEECPQGSPCSGFKSAFFD